MKSYGPSKIDVEKLSQEDKQKYKKFLGVCGLAADLLRSRRYIKKVNSGEVFLEAGTRKHKVFV